MRLRERCHCCRRRRHRRCSRKIEANVRNITRRIFGDCVCSCVCARDAYGFGIIALRRFRDRCNTIRRAGRCQANYSRSSADIRQAVTIRD